MERERRLREGEDITAWKIGGFEKHTKVCYVFATIPLLLCCGPLVIMRGT